MCFYTLGCFRRLGRGLIGWAGVTAGLVLVGSETPTPPASPLNNLVRQLTEKRAAQTAVQAPTKAELLKPEFKFKPAPEWLFLPELARQLTTNETERAAVYNLLDQGARETNRLLAAEGADNEVAAATTFFLTQLWGLVRQQEPAEAAVDALHAQLVALLGGPEMAKLSDAEKQKYWEFCIGFPVFVLGMKEVATEASAQADLRTIAATGFAALSGVRPELVDLGPKGLVLSAAAEAELEKARAAPAPPASSGGGGVPGLTYAPPDGWAREDAAWATIFRATLGDVNRDGSPDPNGQGRHVASIFVLPPRAITQDAHATFDAVWREQFGAFELGDTVVHYRARIAGGLVIHYMGRFFDRKVRNERALKNYGVLYLVDLGGGRVQPITAIVEPVSPGLGMDSFKESDAFRALWRPVTTLLDSIRPAGGPAPHPAGGLFAAADLRGDWSTTSSAFGGFYVNSVTGAGAGAAMHSSAGAFRLGNDGTYDYSIAFATTNPQLGNTRGSENHSGRYRLDGDVVLIEPSRPLGYNFTRCAVGIGTRETPGGLKRILVVVSANNDGVFRAPQLMPNWDYYEGTMTWYVEK